MTGREPGEAPRNRHDRFPGVPGAGAEPRQESAKLVRRGWRGKCLRIFRDSFGGGVNDGRLKQRMAATSLGGAATASLKRTAEGNRART